MIRYALTCANEHSFESWFQSAEAFDTLSSRGMVSCAVCGGTDVQKSVMAPRIGKKGNTEPQAPDERPLSAPASPAEQAMAELRRNIEENSDYVGSDFAREARAMHEGEAPERSIFGEAKLAEAKSLVDDGIPVTPLPFMSPRKTN